MAHGMDIRVYCADGYFWNYVFSDGRMFGEKVSPYWGSPAMTELRNAVPTSSDTHGYIRGSDGGTGAGPQDMDDPSAGPVFRGGDPEQETVESNSYTFSSRGFSTGLWRAYFLDASRACPDAEITICEWFFEANHHVEKVTLKDGAVLAHRYVEAAKDFEVYAAVLYDLFEIMEFECQSCWNGADKLTSNGETAQCDACLTKDETTEPEDETTEPEDEA